MGIRGRKTIISIPISRIAGDANDDIMSICIKLACVRSGWWFSIRISVLEHLLCRAETSRQEDGDIPRGVGTHNEGNVHQTVLCIQEDCGQLGSPTSCCSQNWGLSLAGDMGLSCQLCPSSAPLRVTLGLLIMAAQRDSGSLQHTCSHVANGTGTTALIWKRRKIYIARLDKMLRHWWLDVGRAPAR